MFRDRVPGSGFRQSLLLSPGERQDVDYKSSLPFTGDDSFSLKLIRHIQGMANSGGGWLVIGYAEDSDQGWVPDPSHQSSVCSYYDPTSLSQRVDSSVVRGQRLRLTVDFEEHRGLGLRFPIIQVEGFERNPYISRGSREASDTGERILRQGTVYIRRPGAETSEVSTMNDWEDLISRCMRVRRDEFLVEFRDLFERMISPGTAEPSALQQLNEWETSMRNRAFRM
jgi:hypothetical protein